MTAFDFWVLASGPTAGCLVLLGVASLWEGVVQALEWRQARLEREIQRALDESISWSLDERSATAQMYARWCRRDASALRAKADRGWKLLGYVRR